MWREIFWRLLHSDHHILPHVADRMTPAEVSLALEGEKDHRQEGFTPLNPAAMMAYARKRQEMTLAERIAEAKAK